MGKSLMYYYKHHIGDFRSGTANMTRQERWLYRDMLDVYYDKEQPLPLEIQDVCDSIGATDEEARSVSKILRLKFNQGETGWVHARCEKELENYHNNAETARTNGKLGGRPRKNNPVGFDQVAIGMQSGTNMEPKCNPEESGSQANHKPLTTNQEPLTNKVKPTVPPEGVTDDVREVFAYWQGQRGHERAKLDDKRKKAIKARLKDGYTVGDLFNAIDGIGRSTYHMGQNDSRAVYDDIELICRTAVNVDKFIKLSDPQQFTDPGLQRQVEILKDWMDKP